MQSTARQTTAERATATGFTSAPPLGGRRRRGDVEATWGRGPAFTAPIIPASVRDKIARLDAVRRDGLAASQSASERARELRAELRTAEAELQRHEDPASYGGSVPASSDPKLVALRGRVAAARAASVAADAERDARGARWHNAGQLHANAADFIKNLPDGAELTLAEPVALKLAKGESEPVALARLRSEVEGLHAEAVRIGRLAPTREEARAKIAAQVARLVEAGSPELAADGSISWPVAFAPGTGARLIDVHAALAFVDPEALIAALERRHDALNVGETIRADERTARLAELAAKRLELERQEEALVERLEAKGFSAERRAKADLRAVLGLADNTIGAAG